MQPINLVFNRWDDSGEPLPNLSELSSNIPNATVFPFFLNDINFNVRKCKLDDINKNEKFYFIIIYFIIIKSLLIVIFISLDDFGAK